MDSTVEYNISSNEEQQLTLKLKNKEGGLFVYVTQVYAKCSSFKRLDLWDSLGGLSDLINDSWLMGGDFNVTTGE